MSFQDYFRDKVCVVTGAASGIGLALSEGVLRAGARVVMADRDTATLASAAEGLGALAERAQPFTVDVAREEQVRRLVEETASSHGRLDVLFNNAGLGGTMPIEQATLDHWRRIVDVNLWGVIYGVHFALPIMRRQGHGHIVNTSSIAGLIPFPFQALYCATKYAVLGLSESLRLELADEGIHLSVACPGNVASRIFGTPILGERIEGVPPKDAMPTDEAAQIILAGVANQEGIIVLPEAMKEGWRLYRTELESSEEFLLNMARERRAAYRAADASR